MSGSAASPVILTPGPLEAQATGLQAQVQSLFTPLRFNFEFVPAQMSLKQWNRLGGLAPFVGLGWKGVPVRAEFDSTFHASAQWTLYLIARNAGGVQARYLGDAQGLGLLRMVQSAISLLNGYSIPDAGACWVQSAANLWVDGWEAEGCALASVELQVMLDIDATDTIGFGDVPLLDETDTTWMTAQGETLIVDDDTNIQSEGASA
jgi:hypothetical protein